MPTSVFAVMAVLGLATWQIAPSNVAQPVPAFAPSPSLADGAAATGVDNARLAQGGNATGVKTSYRVSEGSNATGVETLASPMVVTQLGSRRSIGPPKAPTRVVWTTAGHVRL